MSIAHDTTDRLLTEVERQTKYLAKLPEDFSFPLFNAAQALESQRRSGYRNTAAAAREIVDNAIEANVMSSGIKVLVLAVIVGIGSTLFSQFTQGFTGQPTIEDAMGLVLAALSLLGLGIFGPGVANGIISGGPQLGAGAAVGTGLAAGGLVAAGAGLAAGGVGALGAAGGAAAGAARGGASIAGAATTAYRTASAGQTGAGAVASGIGGVARAGGSAATQAAASPLRRAASAMGDSYRSGARSAFKATGGTIERTYMASVSWSYAADQLIALRQQNVRAEAAQPVASGVDLDALNFRYRVEGDTPAWRPLRAYDDGRQVFVEFPRGIAQGEMPPLWVIGAAGGAELVNYRVRGRYMIVDRLFAAAELRLGGEHQKTVRIVRTDGRPTS